MKKIIALLLALLMLLSLAACQSPEQESGKPAETVLEEYNGELPLVKEGEDNVLTIGIMTSPNVTDYDNNAYTLWLEEQTGVDLQFVQFAGSSKDCATQISLMIAGGEELPDILWGFGGIGKAVGEEYGMDGYFVDTTDYFGVYNHYQKQAFETIFGEDWEKPYNTLMSRAIVPTTGRMYNFPAMQDVPLDSPRYHAWVNTEWLETLGLEMPTTVEELYDVLIAFRDGDPNGNGKKDEIPIIGKAEQTFADITGYIVNAYLYWNNAYHINVDENGKLYVPYATDEYREAMIFIRKLVQEGLLPTLTWTQSSSELRSIATGDDGLFTAGILCDHVDSLQSDEAVRIYAPLPPLKDATGKGGYSPQNIYNLTYNNYITADCDNPVLAFKFLDFTMCQDSYLRQRWGEYGVDWQYVDGGPGHLGGEATFQLLNPNAWSEQNAACWHKISSVASEGFYEQLVDESRAEEWGSIKIQKQVALYNASEAAGEPEELFTVLPYSQEETEQRADVRADLMTYFKTCRAEFATGARDPESDADWQAYLDGMEALHLSDWLAIEQTAYDRSMGR